MAIMRRSSDGKLPQPSRSCQHAVMKTPLRTLLPTVCATVAAFSLLGLGGAAAPILAPALVQDAIAPVDSEVVLAVDVSYSMDPDEQHLQREGYVQALTSPDFLQALRAGPNGRIAISYFEWASVGDQKILLPWRLIDGPATAAAAAADLAASPYRRASRTSISGGLMFAQSLFESSGYAGIRRVIDVSGDGPNNNGPPVTPVRDQVVAKGITINGLPIMLKKPNLSAMDIENLDIYYEDCVIGGPGAFVIPIKESDKFTQAIRDKLVQEVAGREHVGRILPVAANAPRVSCTIGEDKWRQRWGD
jgi:Protein of unknown function (DUF1194)